MGRIKRFFWKAPSKDTDFGNSVQSILGFPPKDTQLYERVFTHRSIDKIDDKGVRINYERLEFLGDSVLSTVVSSYLFENLPTKDEGYLTLMRSKIVRRDFLNEIGKGLGLQKLLRSNVIQQHYGEDIHGNLLEALIGAVLVDLGYDTCVNFIQTKVIDPHVNLDALENKVLSYKALLMNWFQRNKMTYNYELFDDTGNESQKHHGARLYVNGKVVSKARETSKKRAVEKASQRAYYMYQDQINGSMLNH
jgi:ribonuclease III